MNIMYSDYVRKKDTENLESFILDLNNDIEDDDDFIKEGSHQIPKVLKRIRIEDAEY